MWKRSVCQATRLSRWVSEVNKATGTKRKVIDGNEIHICEYNGKFNGGMSGIDIEIQTNKPLSGGSEGVRECVRVFIMYVCFMPSDINHTRSMCNFVCLSTTTTARQFSIEIGKWPKLNCSSQCCPGCEFRRNNNNNCRWQPKTISNNRSRCVK